MGGRAIALTGEGTAIRVVLGAGQPGTVGTAAGGAVGLFGASLQDHRGRVVAASAPVCRRRANRRHKFQALVEMAEGQSGRHRKVRLGNLGRGGCYVETDNPLCLGQTAGISITKSEQSFQAQATVVHVVPHKGMGLAFTTVNPEQHRILDR